MKSFVSVFFILLTFTANAKKFTAAELTDLKSRPLLIVLVPDEAPTKSSKGGSGAAATTLNDALKVIPSTWNLATETKIIDAAEFKKLSVDDKKKWSVLTMGAMTESHFSMYRLPTSGKDVSLETLFSLTINRGDNDKYKLYNLSNCDYLIPLPVSTNSVSGISLNEMKALITLVQKHIEDSIIAGELLDFETYGNQKEKENCSKLETAKVYFPNLMKPANIDAEKYGELKILKPLTNSSFDSKFTSIATNEYILISFANTQPSSGVISGGALIAGEVMHWIINPVTGEIIASYKTTDTGHWVIPKVFEKGVKCK